MRIALGALAAASLNHAPQPAGSVAAQMANAPKGNQPPAKKLPMSDTFEAITPDMIILNPNPTTNKFRTGGGEGTRLAYIRTNLLLKNGKAPYCVAVYHSRLTANDGTENEVVNIRVPAHGRGASKVDLIGFPGREDELKAWTDYALEAFLSKWENEKVKPEATAYVGGSGRAVQGFLKKKATTPAAPATE